MSAAGSYSRVPLGEAFDVMCNELDDILNRVLGIEEVAMAYQWMHRHSWKVPDRLGGEEAVGQAAGSGSAATNGEPERASSPPSVFACDPCECGGSDECERCGLVGEPPSLTGTDSPEASLGTGESRKHGGGSPTRHLAAVPKASS